MRMLQTTFAAVIVAASALMTTAVDAQTRFIGSSNGTDLLFVFVHGIEGDARGTWTNKNGAYWPRIVKDEPEFAGSDVYVYDFASTLTGRGASISEHALNLQNQLTADTGANIGAYKKVIIVAHSLGGLIAREYLARDRRNHDRIAGLFLFGSPVGGSFYADIVSLISRSETIQELTSTGRASTYLEDLADRWVGGRPPIQVNSWCAYETESLGPRQVVSNSSARILCNRAVRPLAGDHLEIVKPDGPDHPSHDMLRYWVRDAIPGMTENYRVTETPNDVVFASCSESFYSTRVQSQMIEISRNLRQRNRLSLLLPIEYTPAKSFLWRKEEPKIVVIHLSCFEQRPSTRQSTIDRTKAFNDLLRELKDTRVKVVVYSRAIDNERQSGEISRDLSDYYNSQNRLFFVPLVSERNFLRDGGSKVFARVLERAIR